MDLKGKRITVAGLGRSGFAAAGFLKDMGCDVWVTDSSSGGEIDERAAALKERGVNVELGGHSKRFISSSDMLVVSPGVGDESAPIRMAKEAAIPIIGEIELGYLFCKAPIIAITGTNGKSTTTSLIGHILKEAGKNVSVSGNIGIPFTGEVASYKDDTVAVLEISSFQLEYTRSFRPKISLILNITDDHIDRHGSMEEYSDKKKKIFENQGEGDTAVLNYDDAGVRPLADECNCDVLYFSRMTKVKGAYVDGMHIYYDAGEAPEKVMHIKDIGLAGEHNTENVLAAVIAARCFGVAPDTIRKAVSGFKGLAHRCEYVDTVNGIDFVDDSKGTNVDATVRAIGSYAKPIVLIAGGRDKDSDFTAADGIVCKKVVHVVLIGEAKDRIAESISPSVKKSKADSLRGAVRMAFESAAKGDMVLLSPMCSSFDMFRDYKDRGDQFKALVKELKDGGKE
ncbi:MAG: UDP-N-acetylmuramoylalanine--D-glutamate ligase [Candidatus Omnitrophica bacterium CG1_02_49_10]|nr:MAG: UDP-N-acetylmuramoylalanine--D-glutamate ligase [Candidatus Omnitrophica bacterium CG1_02_49_10]